MEGLSFALATQLQLNGRLPGPKSRAVDCIICLEPFSDSLMVTAPCSHSYCFSDFKELFMRACKDEQLFPPRCCRQELSLDLILPLFNNQEANEFLDKSDEYNCKDRTYCSKPSCSHFISAGNISREIATCTECHSRTCTLCKKEEHGSGDCPDDPSMKLTLETAAANGWQRCQQCHALLEKTHGCQHMTCRCKAEWCYGCGTKWKTCECSVWDEGHLHRRAEDLAIRNLGAGAGASALAIAAGAIREELITNHECTHTGGWEFLRSGAICELCMDYLPNFIFVCAGCRMMACNRCHVNRI